MTEVKIETSQRKNRWPLWLLIGLLIAALAATQVPSLRLALARVLVLSGPRLTRDWARGQISSAGPLAAPILLEWCIQAFSRIRDENDENDENDEELVDDFYQALEDCETCIDRCPEVLAELLMATRARAPEALRQRLYHYAIVRLHDCPQEQRAASAPVSIDRLVEMGREVYATLPPSFMDLAGEERISPELLEHLLSLGVPLSELDAIYAQRLAEPNPIKRLPILEALDFAVSEHRDSERIPEESRIFKALTETP